ncbi:photosystem II reaction center protein Psb28 [Pseudanabaena mucicola]|uniref:Photosystem II reaction center Psb28 protein n=1 Tax=Pseudanabaena mucicola FACHB-723 TaxID=2692860 RepID=A0ABR7ZZD0_9CYAN|nr:photosystem II reaction center protein Psb28 [Pseudanabaena mucicola]MBD2189232.1 photosystem II reaction center protein Psb28 [Pseudanabaena mucicola FACHB-723]
MNSITPSIEFFAGIPEELSDVRLRRDRKTGENSVKMTFVNIKAVQGANSFAKASFNDIRLVDSEGVISIEPRSSKLFWKDKGDDEELAKIEIVFDVSSTAHWDRFMRFMERYSAANGWEFTSNPDA